MDCKKMSYKELLELNGKFIKRLDIGFPYQEALFNHFIKDKELVKKLMDALKSGQIQPIYEEEI